MCVSCGARARLRDRGARGAVDAQDDVARLQRALPLGGAAGDEDGHGGVALEEVDVDAQRAVQPARERRLQRLRGGVVEAALGLGLGFGFGFGLGLGSGLGLGLGLG